MTTQMEKRQHADRVDARWEAICLSTSPTPRGVIREAENSAEWDNLTSRPVRTNVQWTEYAIQFVIDAAHDEAVRLVGLDLLRAWIQEVEAEMAAREFAPDRDRQAVRDLSIRLGALREALRIIEGTQ